MRISNSDLTGLAGTDSAQAQDLQKTGRGGNASSNTLGGGQDGDHVVFSSGLSQLASTISTYGANRSAQVQKLAALYQGGGYRADSAATSRAMVSEALSAGVQ
jgi:hypothetical protein